MYACHPTPLSIALYLLCLFSLKHLSLQIQYNKCTIKHLLYFRCGSRCRGYQTKETEIWLSWSLLTSTSSILFYSGCKLPENKDLVHSLCLRALNNIQLKCLINYCWINNQYFFSSIELFLPMSYDPSFSSLHRK